MITTTDTAQRREVGSSRNLPKSLSVNRATAHRQCWSSINSIVTHSESNFAVLHSCSGGWTKLLLVSKDVEVVQCGSGKSHWEAGWKQQDVAVLLCASQSTISKLQLRYRDAHDVKDRPRSGSPRITTDKSGSFNSPGDFGESSHHCTQPTDALSRTSWQAGVYTDHQEPATCFPVEIPESCPEASPNSWSSLITCLACELCLTISTRLRDFGKICWTPPLFSGPYFSVWWRYCDTISGT